MSKKRISLVFWIVVIVVPVVGIILSLTDPLSFYTTQETRRARVIRFGIRGPLIFIGIQALQVIITPINHYAVGILGGFLYGPYIGGFYNWIGRMLGHGVSFFLAKTFLRKWAYKFVKKETIKTYDKRVGDKYLLLFLMYFLPFFPDDELSYLAGLSSMNKKWFFLINGFGHVGGSLGLAYIGAGIDTKDTVFRFWFVLTLVGFIGFRWYMKKYLKHAS